MRYWVNYFLAWVRSMRNFHIHTFILVVYVNFFSIQFVKTLFPLFSTTHNPYSILMYKTHIYMTALLNDVSRKNVTQVSVQRNFKNVESSLWKFEVNRATTLTFVLAIFFHFRARCTYSVFSVLPCAIILWIPTPP